MHTPTVGHEELEARLQIQTAIDDYALGLDTRDLERFLRAWHEDATWDVDHPPAVCRGHGEIAAFAEAAWKDFAVLNHFTTNHIVDLDTKKASGIGHAGAMMASTDGLYITAAAVFHDTYERRDGTWRLSYRKVALNHWSDHPHAVVTTTFAAATEPSQ